MRWMVEFGIVGKLCGWGVWVVGREVEWAGERRGVDRANVGRRGDVERERDGRYEG